MSKELFWRVANEAVGLGVRHIVPFINGEPFADSRMPEFVEGLAQLYPDVNVILYTNASLLTEEKARRVLAAGNVGAFNISIQGGSKEVMERNMGLDWDVVMENVDRLIRLNEEYKTGRRIRVNMCVFSKTADTVAAFVARWEPVADVCLGAFSNFGGMASDAYAILTNHMQRKPCARALNHLYVYWNGDVGQCCFDLLGSTVHGNVTDRSLADVISDVSWQYMRKAHLAMDVPNMPQICHACNACKFGG
jgi:sulfatase maturation enzyme AslB (radical SAM superfamily)